MYTFPHSCYVVTLLKLYSAMYELFRSCYITKTLNQTFKSVESVKSGFSGNIAITVSLFQWSRQCLSILNIVLALEA